MNVSVDPLWLEENEAQLIENMEFNSDGERLRTRRGLGAPLYSFESDVLYIWNDYELNMYIIFLKDGSIYKYEVGKLPVLIGKLNGDTSHHPSVARYGTKILIASGSTLQIYEYNETTVNTDSSYPICDTVMERFSRILVSMRGSNNIKYSGIGNPTNWTQVTNDASSCKDIDVGDISGISGIYPFVTDILVFKENGNVYKVSNEPEDWNVIQVGVNSDFITNDAMTNLGGDVIYLSRKGLRSSSASETYGNYTESEIGEKCNPIIEKETGSPFISKLIRSRQLIVSPNSGSALYVYHYNIKAFTKWTFPVSISTICEGVESVLVGAGPCIYQLSANNKTDTVDSVSHPIHQTILSREIPDLSTMTLYRNYIRISSDNQGSAKLTVNSVSWDWNWTIDKQREEFKTQIRSDNMTFKFETDDIITWQFWEAIVVQQYVKFQSTNGNDRGGSSSWSKNKWGQGTFAGTVTSSGGSPYGYV